LPRNFPKSGAHFIGLRFSVLECVMKTATLNKGFAAFLGLVLIGVSAAIAFTTPAPSSHAAAGHPLPGAAMDGGYVSVEPADAPPVVEARLLSDSEIVAGEPVAMDAVASADGTSPAPANASL
jgi:hypothetical protein